MKVDDYGRIILDEMDLCHLYMIDPQKNGMEYLVQEEIVIHPDLELPNPPVFKLVSNADLSLREFDEIQQAGIFSDHRLNRFSFSMRLTQFKCFFRPFYQSIC